MARNKRRSGGLILMPPRGIFPALPADPKPFKAVNTVSAEKVRLAPSVLARI